MADKIFCGSGKTFGQYGQVLINLCLSEIPHEFIRESNGKKYVNLKLNKKKEVDARGNTHYIEVDTWKPQQQPRNNNDWD